MLIVTDPDPPEKVEKKWDRYDFKDPNRAINVERVRWKKPPIDYYNMGYIYTLIILTPPLRHANKTSQGSLVNFVANGGSISFWDLNM